MKKTPLFLTFLFIGSLFFASFHDARAQINRGIAVPPEKMPKTLSDISPKDYFIPSDQKKVGVVHALEGTVIVIHGTKEAYFGMEGDAIHEKDSLITLPESKCRIRFVDEDVVTMAPETEFSVESFEDQRAEGKKSSLFRMVKGKAMFYAMRLFRYRDTRFSLVTPTNTIGVRGTKFGAHVYFLENSKTASRSILVADAGNEVAPYLAQAGSGRSFTDCFSEDGVLDVDGQTVAPGQMYNGQTGQVIPTPPEVIRSFRQDAEIRPGGAATGPGQGTEGEQPPPPPPVPSSTGPAIADIQANITTVVQVQTGQQTEQQAGTEIKSLPPPLEGYFSLLLQKNGSFYDAFMNSGRTRTDVLKEYLYGVMNSNNYLYVDSPSGLPDRGIARLDAPPDSGGSLNAAWTKNYLGQGTYTQWGYWQAPSAATTFESGGNNYQFITDRVWFLEGNNVTTQAQLDAIPSGSYAYSGSVYGTYAGSDGSAQLNGTFSGKLNIGSATVQDLRFSGTGGGHRFLIEQTGSAVSVSANSSGNSFHLSSSDLNATIDDASASYRNVNGSFYGANAQEVGGNCAAADSVAGKAVSAIFNGKKAQ